MANRLADMHDVAPQVTDAVGKRGVMPWSRSGSMRAMTATSARSACAVQDTGPSSGTTIVPVVAARPMNFIALVA
jgi:hypothetical protein